MRTTVQRHAILLAALLHVLPIVRNFVLNSAAASNFAFILRWGIGTATVLGAYDARSAASNYFTSATNFTGTAGVFFTNNLTILSSQGDGSALCTITTNGVSAVLANGQTSTFGMAQGLTLKFYDPNNGKQNSLYVAIYGTPTPASVGTNAFHIDLSRAGSPTVPGDFKIIIAATGGSSPPIITNQPASTTNLVSSNATFTVLAGTAPLKYQWYFNTNNALANMTNTSLTVTNIQLTNTGYYSVIVTNSSGSVTSSTALLTVWQPPVITNQPGSVTNVAGGGATFTVTAGGVPALNYQWRLNPGTSESGATAATFNLTNIRSIQAGSYSVVITNSAGAITSTPAILVITNPLPPRLAVTQTGGGQFQLNFNAVPGLTNTVLTNGNLVGGIWGVLTNVPPPAVNNLISITNPAGFPNLFYRLQIIP
ncbi:MAG TPA: immunoglobulin domain-containing protein [Verrucomicrobiae bacterium]|nr:immunoglobulin domain-containing protein [Verrucomicrobiae bacterium]